MIKAVIFFKRRPDMALEAFHRHWRTQHAGIISRLPGLKAYVQNYPVPSESMLDKAAYDAVAESSFEDTAAMKALARSPEYAEVLADEPRFIDRPSMGTVITEEHVLRHGPTAGLKRVRFVVRKPGTPVDDFFAAFLEHGRAAARAGGVLRYVQCHTRRSAYQGGRSPAYDGVEMVWCGRNAELAPLPEFADAERSASMGVIERIVAPAAAEKQGPSLV